MTTLQEEWRSVHGYEGLYEVSNRGRVRSLGRDTCRVDGNRYVMPPRVLRAWRQNGEYRAVSLSKAGRVRKFLVHRLVARAFIGVPPKGKSTVNHIDADPANNSVENLEYLSQADNVRHSAALGRNTPPRGEECVKAKINDRIVREIRRLYPRVSGPRLAAQFGLSANAVYKVVHRRTWSHVD